MARIDRNRALLPAAALLLCCGTLPAASASLGTTEHTLFMSVWLNPEVRAEAPDSPALLNLPPGWSSGDAAVVLAPGAWPPGLRDRLVAALLDAGAAVLEMSPRSADLRQDFASALRTMRQAFGAGLVVTIGRDAGGEAALEAAAGQTPEGWRYAAAVRLGPGVPGFRLGAVAPDEAWPARAPLLCDLLGAAQPAGEPPIAPVCRTALLAQR